MLAFCPGHFYFNILWHDSATTRKMAIVPSKSFLVERGRLELLELVCTSTLFLFSRNVKCCYISGVVGAGKQLKSFT